MSEVWSSNIDFYSNILDGYNFYYDLPDSKKAGGVGVFIKKSLTQIVNAHYKLMQSHADEFENIWFEIVCQQKKYVLGCIYRHPNCHVGDFQSALEATLSKISNQKLPCLIVGDINIDLIKWAHHKPTNEYLDSLITNNFLPLMVLPTRITRKSCTLIDHIYFYEGQHKHVADVRCGNILSDISDHLSNYVLLIENHNKAKLDRPMVRLFSESNKKQFRDRLTQFDWSVVCNEHNVDAAFNIFSTHVTTCFNASFPKVRLSRRRARDKCWVTSALKKSSRTKCKLYKRWLLTKDKEDEERYKNYRRVFKKVSLECENNYYKELFDRKSNSVRQLWKNLNTVCNLKGRKSSDNTIPAIRVNGNKLDTAVEISNAFNVYFSTVADTLLSNRVNNPSKLDFSAYCHEPQKNSMFLEPVCKQEVLTEILRLDNLKSPGPDSLGPKIIKDIASIIIEPLTYICNLSFQTGLVPDELKRARIVPIYKKGDRSVITNYRPISLLSVFHKILEKLMCSRLNSFLKVNRILYDYQFGFRSNHSTVLALIEVIDNIYYHLDNKDYIVGIYLDLQKAFDTVNHEILLCKLYNYGIRGVPHSWFQSYLKNRKQFTSVNGVCSDDALITCGVPQGSVLGPILFLLYINDMPNAVPGEKLRLFADDTNLFVVSKTAKELNSLANIQLNKLNHWLLANKLHLSIEKTSYTAFPSSGPPCLKDMEVRVENSKIQQVPCCKYLGVIIDEDLKWIKHIELVYNKLVKFIGIFYKLRSKLPAWCLRTIYYSYVHPHLLYGIEVYANTHSTYLDKIIKLNNKLLRILQNKDTTCCNFDLYLMYNTLPVDQLHVFQLLCLVHKFVHNKHELPQSFITYFMPNSAVHDYPTRTSNKLHLMPIKSTYGHRIIRFKASLAWNNLPANLTDISNFNSFKKNLKLYLLSYCR